MPVSITLQFDSIDDARDALRRLTDGEVAEPAPKTKSEPEPEPKAEAKDDAKAKADAAVARVNKLNREAREAKKARAAKGDKPAAESTEHTYADVQSRVYRLAAVDRAAAVAIANDLGVGTFKELDPAQYDDAVARLDAKLSEVEG